MDIANYDEQVYAGVLGKVIGVYMGRPFEGWQKKGIIEHFGRVDRYVAAEHKVPLVVSDDDISGTFTFIRALEDTGRYGDTPDEDFGRMWQNYIIENKTILWWGGLGISTEHTAFLRLKQGVASPESGSIARNGKSVAEQIGAQIFIDAYGMVAPGDPQLAVTLARKSARVSHDGEAVNGALVVAAMVSAAFVEKDMETLLDIGVSVIPADSLIARVHHDVRAWSKQDGDWQKTFARIEETYGYAKYGGGCHMVPNHALMVMAWSYAPDSFRESQMIINTAGWDTDCNAANVGSVMGIKVGLDGINRDYDFQGPIADRIIMPTAEGTRHITDCLKEAQAVARIGRRVMGWPEIPAPKDGAFFHFSQKGARHGFQTEPTAHGTPGAGTVSNIAVGGLRALAIDVADVTAERTARITTPILAEPSSGGGYAVMGTPRLYPGMSVELAGSSEVRSAGLTARLFVRAYDAITRKPTRLIASEAIALLPGAAVAVSLVIPDLDGWPVCELGIEIAGTGSGRLVVDRIRFTGAPRYALACKLPRNEAGAIVGWVSDLDISFRGPVRGEQVQVYGKSEGRGIAVTGTTDWRDYTFSANFCTYLVDRAGLVVRYQGLERYLAVVKTADALQLVLRFYGERVLATHPCRWDEGDLHRIEASVRGTEVVVRLDGREVLRGNDDRLGSGGAGFVAERGGAGFRDVVIAP